MKDAAQWEERYRTGDTPWEKGAGSPGLVDFLEQHPELRRGSVLVPGCGTGHDVCIWARHGFTVTGLDLAPSALRLAEERTRSESVTASFQLADFLEPSAPGTFDWVFEHTLYCAINPSDRERYARAASDWIKPGGHLLAVHYMIDDREGPPFGCTQEEVMRRFGPDFELLHGWIPRSHPNRLGLELMLWWRRR